jgi:ABC-type phosphate/phosphonate transport system permease subunit
MKGRIVGLPSCVVELLLLAGTTGTKSMESIIAERPVRMVVVVVISVVAVIVPPDILVHIVVVIVVGCGPLLALLVLALAHVLALALVINFSGIAQSPRASVRARGLAVFAPSLEAVLEGTTLSLSSRLAISRVHEELTRTLEVLTSAIQIPTRDVSSD